MDPTTIQYLLDTYGAENIAYIAFGSGKTYYIKCEAHNRPGYHSVTFDIVNQLCIVTIAVPTVGDAAAVTINAVHMSYVESIGFYPAVA